MRKQPKVNIYKKSLAMELIKLGHDFHHSMRNRNNDRYQVYVFIDTLEIRKDMARLSGKTYRENL